MREESPSRRKTEGPEACPPTAATAEGDRGVGAGNAVGVGGIVTGVAVGWGVAVGCGVGGG